MCSKPIFCSKIALKGKTCSRLLKPQKVAQKLPSTIGIGLQARPWPKKSQTAQNVTQKSPIQPPKSPYQNLSPKKVLTKISHPKKVITKFQTQKKSSYRKFQTQRRASYIPVTYIPEYPPWGVKRAA